MTASTSTPNAAAANAGLTAYEQIDSRPLTGHQKSLVALAVIGNIAEFFDIFMVGFVISGMLNLWLNSGL